MRSLKMSSSPIEATPLEATPTGNTKKPYQLSSLTAAVTGLGFFGASYAAGMAGIPYLAVPAQLATYGGASLAALLISNPLAQVIAGSILAAFAFALLAVAVAAVCNLALARMNAKAVDAPTVVASEEVSPDVATLGKQ